MRTALLSCLLPALALLAGCGTQRDEVPGNVRPGSIEEVTGRVDGFGDGRGQGQLGEIGVVPITAEVRAEHANAAPEVVADIVAQRMSELSATAYFDSLDGTVRMQFSVVLLLGDQDAPAGAIGELCANRLVDARSVARLPARQRPAPAVDGAPPRGWLTTSQSPHPAPLGAWFTSDEVASGDRLLTGARA